MSRKRSRSALDDIQAREAREAKKPCDTCALSDPSAWLADIGMHRKILDALQGRARFYCHEGVPFNADGYQPERREDGSIDQAKLSTCGGFLRWALRLWKATPKAKRQAVNSLQHAMLTRWLASDDPLAQEWRDHGWDAAKVQLAVQMTDTYKQAEGRAS